VIVPTQAPNVELGRPPPRILTTFDGFLDRALMVRLLPVGALGAGSKAQRSIARKATSQPIGLQRAAALWRVTHLDYK
jgi:hypothetical protein